MLPSRPPGVPFDPAAYPHPYTLHDPPSLQHDTRLSPPVHTRLGFPSSSTDLSYHAYLGSPAEGLSIHKLCQASPVPAMPAMKSFASLPSQAQAQAQVQARPPVCRYRSLHCSSSFASSSSELEVMASAVPVPVRSFESDVIHWTSSPPPSSGLPITPPITSSHLSFPIRPKSTRRTLPSSSSTTSLHRYPPSPSLRLSLRLRLCPCPAPLPLPLPLLVPVLVLRLRFPATSTTTSTAILTTTTITTNDSPICSHPPGPRQAHTRARRMSSNPSSGSVCRSLPRSAAPNRAPCPSKKSFRKFTAARHAAKCSIVQAPCSW
jgi:hypothetical protein